MIIIIAGLRKARELARETAGVCFDVDVRCARFVLTYDV